MGKSKAPPHIKTSTSRSKKSAAGEKHEAAHEASTPSAGKAAEETAYQPRFAHIAKVMCQIGANYALLAHAFQVDEDTIRTWIGTYKDFAAGCKYGMNFADDTVERSLYQLALGYEQPDVKIFRYKGQVIYAPITKHVVGSVEACIFWLINRRPEEWSLYPERKPAAADANPLAKLYEAICGTKFMPNEDQTAYLESGGNYISPEWEEDDDEQPKKVAPGIPKEDET